MILYTMVPEELIFYDEQNVGAQETLEVPGGILVVEPLSHAEYKVVRLISSDPAQYLNTNYQPGCILTAKPQL